MKIANTALSAALIGSMIAAPASAANLRATALSTAWTPTHTQALSFLRATDFGAVSAAMPLHIVVGLTGNRAAADAMIKHVFTKGDASYHQFLTPAQFTALYAPSASSAQAVANYLQSAGFTGISVAPNRLIVSAYGTAGVAQKAFNTSLHAFALNGKAIYANVAPASVPAQLSGLVTSVLGLDNIQRTTFHLRSPQATVAHSLLRLQNGKITPISKATSPCVNPGPVCTLNTYFPNDLRVAYNDEASFTGKSTDVAIFTEGDLTAPIKDLYQSLRDEGQALFPLIQKNVYGPFTDTSGDDEWDIDTQSSANLSGGVHSMTFYNGADLSSASIAATFNQFAVDDTAQLGNASFGGCEAVSYAEGEMQTDDFILAQTVLQGQSVFASTGDGGSQCSLVVNAGAPVGGPAQGEYPGTSPYVTAVGGTSLMTNTADGTYYGEIAWVNGGGDISYFENTSPWQYNNITLAQTGHRLTPDIAMDADPNVSGMNTIVAGTYTGYGGTSLASPLAMGIYARLMSRHGNKLGEAAASLYQNYNFVTNNSDGVSTVVPSGLTTQLGGFHDILVGTNTAYQTTPGYDLNTGIGTLDINNLLIAYGS